MTSMVQPSFLQALLNALELADKKAEDVKLVVSGAGSAAFG
jgi:malic enzyme